MEKNIVISLRCVENRMVQDNFLHLTFGFKRLQYLNMVRIYYFKMLINSQEFYGNGSRKMVAIPKQKKGKIYYQNSKQAKIEILNASTVKEYDAKGKLVKTRTVKELTDKDGEIKKLLPRINGKKNKRMGKKAVLCYFACIRQPFV